MDISEFSSPPCTISYLKNQECKNPSYISSVSFITSNFTFSKQTFIFSQSKPEQGLKHLQVNNKETSIIRHRSRSNVFVNFEHNSHLVQYILMLTLSKSCICLLGNISLWLLLFYPSKY